MTASRIIATLLVFSVTAGAQDSPTPGLQLAVGSKKFTESVILGEVLKVLGEQAGADVQHRAELGGTRILFNALTQGDIDAYVEYTGTITQEIFSARGLRSFENILAALAEHGVRASEPLGFNNTYALGMRAPRAAALNIRTMSDLTRHPELKFGLTNEFMDRGDGWPSLRAFYGLPQTDVRGLDHDLAYRALTGGTIDVMDLYMTDAEIAEYALAVITDDRGHFPAYHAVILYRADLDDRAPRVRAAWCGLADGIDETAMIAMNRAVKIQGRTERGVAAEFCARRRGAAIPPTGEEAPRSLALWARTTEHLWLVGCSMLAAIVVAIPLGIWAAKAPRLGQIILGIVGIIQTIPALALLVLLMALLQQTRWLGIAALGEPPAILALFLYSLLPIVRNTCTAIQTIPGHIRESAEALGLPPGARLWHVELPMASQTILAGIKTAAVINVGFATLGALIAAGGYGQPILTGIRLDDMRLILGGAIPAAAMALAMQGLFEVLERVLVPKGLRKQAA